MSAAVPHNSRIQTVPGKMMKPGSYIEKPASPAGIVRGILLAAAAVVLSSCSSMESKPQAPYGKIFAGVQQSAAPVEEEKAPEPEPNRTVYEQKGSEQFIGSTGSQAPVVRLGDGKVEVNFRDAPLAEVVKVILGDNLHVPYTIEGDIKGNVTLTSSSAVTEDALIGLLESLLANRGIVMVRDASASTASVRPRRCRAPRRCAWAGPSARAAATTRASCRSSTSRSPRRRRS